MTSATPAIETTIAGSLPKPSWLARPRSLWAPWQLSGEQLAEGGEGGGDKPAGRSGRGKPGGSSGGEKA